MIFYCLICQRHISKLICIVCAKSCVTSNDCKTCSECVRSMHLTCSTSKIKDKSFQNKRFASSYMLCDSRIVDASFDKQFVTTRSQDLILETVLAIRIQAIVIFSTIASIMMCRL